MLRTVASPGTYGCHDRRFFCKCTEVTDNSCAPSAWCKYQGSAELRSWTTTEFSHSAGGPQLELRWGPGRAKRARARLTNFRPPLRPEKPDRKINSAPPQKKKKVFLGRKKFFEGGFQASAGILWLFVSTTTDIAKHHSVAVTLTMCESGSRDAPCDCRHL